MTRTDRAARAIGLVSIVAALVVTIAGGPSALAILVAGGMAIWLASRAAGSGPDRDLLVKAALLAFAARAILTTAVHLVLRTRTPDGSMFLDDAGYVLLGRVLARLWAGEPLSTGEIGLLADSSIAPGYVLTSGVVFRVLGDSVLSLKLLNTAVGVLWAPLVYRIMRNAGLPGSRLAAVLVLVFPSLVLWSSLALKDAVAGAVMLVAVWSVTEAIATGRRWPWAVTVLALLALRDTRVYVFLILAFAWPVAALVGTRGRRWVPAAAAFVISFVLVVTHDAAIELLDAHTISGIATTRTAMAEGARSAFVRRPPVAVASPGFVFRVEVPGSSCDPALPRRRHQVPAGSQLDVEGASTAAPVPGAPSRAAFSVRPCDEIVMLPPEATPMTAVITDTPRDSSPTATPTPAPLPVVRVEPERVNIVATPGPVEAGDRLAAAAQDDIRHLPIGMLYVLTAPFPLAASTPAELAFAPEMLLWYALVLLAAVGIARVVARRDWRSAIALFTLAGIFLVMSLVEGNVGTLVRHRAMLVPFVAIFGSYGVFTMPRLARIAARIGDAG